MAQIPDPTHTARAEIDRWHQSRPGSHRYHLGASLLGHHCDRWLWLTFRWAVKEEFSGRMLRLFRRGQNEEEIVVADLRAIGCDVQDVDHDGRQMRVDFGKHVSGSMDGKIHSGLPESPSKAHILEIKTHSLKSFKGLLKDGLKKSKPMHWAQCQVYMRGTGIDRAFYFAVCKDDDSIFTDRVKYDHSAASALIQRGHRITMADRMPEPCHGGGPDWYQCKFCPAHNFCWNGESTREVNCRTCAHYTASPDSTNYCERWQASIPSQSMPGGCRSHVLHPDMVPWELKGGDGVNGHYVIGGELVINGEDGQSSREILEGKC